MPAAISFPGNDAGGIYAANPFNEQLEFFKKKLQLPSERFDNILKSAHDRAFIVAGAANADLLNDLHSAITRAIQDGKGLEAFRKEFKDIVLRHGWTGWTGEGSKAGQAWRTRVIYQTNMATSYAAGRWKQLTNPKLLADRPYWKYVHADGILHPRPLHVSWHGMVLPHDHPFWRTHFPPNGWGCHCTVVAVTAEEYAKAKAQGRAEPPPGWDQVSEKTGAPVGIDQGWGYAPGANTERQFKELIDAKLINLDAPIGSAMYSALLPVLRAERQAAYGQFLDEVLVDPVKRGRTSILGAIERSALDWLASEMEITPASAEIAIQDGLLIGKKAARHQLAGDALTPEEWRKLPALLDAPEQVLFDTRTGKLLYIVRSDDTRLGKLAVEFDFKQKRDRGELNMIVSGFKVPAEAIEADIKGGFLKVVK